MDQEKEKYLQDEGYFLIKEIFLRRLYEREDIKIPFGDAEETFLSLWIFIHKKNPHIATRSREPGTFATGQAFYEVHISGNSQTRKYLDKLLISFRKQQRKNTDW